MVALLTGCLLLLGVATTASAQTDVREDAEVALERPTADQGYYLSLGAHVGELAMFEDGDSKPGALGYALTLRLGQALTPYFDLGLRFDYGSLAFDDRGGTFGGVGLDAGLRPHGPWLLRFGVGLAANSLGAPVNSDDDASAFGAVAALELGYSIFPTYESGSSGSWALTPILRLVSIELATSDAAYWVMLGIEITRWTGLPRNQLDLTLEQAFPVSQDAPSPAPTDEQPTTQ